MEPVLLVFSNDTARPSLHLHHASVYVYFLNASHIEQISKCSAVLNCISRHKSNQASTHADMYVIDARHLLFIKIPLSSSAGLFMCLPINARLIKSANQKDTIERQFPTNHSDNSSLSS